MRKLLNKFSTSFRKILLTFLAFWLSFIMPIFGGSIAGVNVVQQVSANSIVGLADCGHIVPGNGTRCYVRGIFTDIPDFWHPPAQCTVTHRIYYTPTKFYNFCAPGSSLSGQEVTAILNWYNSPVPPHSLIFGYESWGSSATYNQTPSQPAIYSPQSLWELGPRTESLYTEFSCDYSGTGQGCNVLFRTDVYDPDFYNFLNSTFQVRSTQGGNRDYVRTNMGWEDRWITLNDGNWSLRGQSCDPYICSGWTAYRNFIVDTTAPSVVNMVAEPAYTAGTQNTVSSNISADNIIGGVRYYFEAATDAAFTNIVNASGWIEANSFTFAGLTDGQEYFYRGRSRDSLHNTNAWGATTSSIQDATAPVLSNINITSQRISPANADGIEDDTTISFDWVELNPQEATISIYNVSDLVNPLRVETQDLSSLPVPNTDPVNFTFTWDGRDQGGNLVADATYNAVLTVTDRAGNIATDNNLYTIVDNVPADISISNPANGSWFNVNNFTINGQTEADALLTAYSYQLSAFSNVVLDAVGIFAHSDVLSDGANSFDLTSTDIVGNVNTVNLNYYKENQAPSINSITPNSQINTQTPEIVLNLQDFGYDDGTNNYISGINTHSVFLSLNHPSFSGGELVLVNGGVNVAPSLGNIVENCSSQTGTFGNSGAEICEYKFVFSTNLTPNGDFEIKANVADRAGNQGSDTFQSFHLDSFVQNDIHTPTNGQQFNYSLIELTGTAERYSQVSISVPDVDGDLVSDSVIFNLDTEIIDGRIEITNCRASANPTSDGIKEICDWKVSNFQLERDIVNNVAVNNPISITVTDNFSNQPDAAIRNVDTKVINVGVNLFAVSLSISSDLQYFSPNGDGMQDGVEFINISTDGVLGDWTIEIKDSGNNVVKSFTGSVGLPGNLPWDGRDDSGDYLVDGDYTYELNIITTDGISFSTPPQTIKAVTELTDAVIITYPGNDTYVTRGVTNVQGQAPVGTTVRICVDTIGLAASCDFEYYADVDANGSFTTIIPLVRLDGSSITEHHITAKAFDKYGNETPNSNSVKISTTIASPFESIRILPAFSGVNNEADYQLIVDKLNNGEEITLADINSLRTVVFRSTVNQGTERVRFSFTDHTNLDQLPVPTNFSYLGYIDGLNETKLFQMYVDGVNAINNCGTTTCQWDFVYPVPSVGGGLYEIQFEGKLGSEIQRITAALILDGNIPTAPIILDIDKIIGGVSSNTFIFENAYYSNSYDVQIKGVADSNASITVTDQHGNTVCIATASAIGFWSCSASLSDSDYSLTTSAVLGANTATSLEDVNLVIDTIAPTLTGFNTTSQWHKSGDLVDLVLSADERLSFATHIDTDMNAIGSQCINATSTFDIFGLAVPIQLGKKDDLNLNTNRLGAIGSFTVHGMAVEGRYCTTLELRDLAGNVTNTPLTFYIDNTDPDKAWIDTTTWGIYNGIHTQPGFIAQGRTNPGYVHEENTVNIVGYAEEGLFVEIFVNSNKVGEVQAFNRSMLDPGGNPYCIQRYDVNGVAVDDLIFDGVLVESKFDCPFVYNHQFSLGEIGYIIQARARDYALNYALVSQSELVYYDITAPRRPETLNVRKSNGAVINDWIVARNEDVTAALGTGNFGRIPISNDRNIVATDYGEAKSDMLYYAVDPAGNLFKQEYQLKQDSGRNEVVYNLGADGVYTFFSTSTDAAGNESQRHLFQMELDTVAPGRPGVGLSLAGGVRPTAITMSVQGEPGGFPSAAPSIKIPRNGSTAFTIKSLSVYNDADWERTFTFCSGVYDRAGNLSQNSCDSVRTPVRPPRPGECSLSDSQKIELENKISSGEWDYDTSTTEGTQALLNDYYSKSCLVYEPKLISDEIFGEVNNTINEINTLIGQQNKFNECLNNNFNNYCDKGGCWSTQDASQSLVNQCKNESGLVLSEKEVQDTNTLLTDKYQQVKDQNKRGELADCKWLAWPWEEGSCIREGVTEAVHYASEAVGAIVAFSVATSPIGLLVGGAVDLINGRPIGTTTGDIYNSVQSGFSSGIKNIVHGIADLGKSVIDLSGHFSSLVVGGLEAGINVLTGGPNTNVITNYHASNDRVKNYLGWDVGNVGDDLLKVGAAAVAIVATVATAGAAAAVLGVATGTAGAIALAVGAGMVIAPIVGIATTQFSLQTGIGQIDRFEKVCERGPVLEAESYDKLCDSNGEFSYEKFQESDLKRDVNSTDLKTMMCGDDSADIVQCLSYQGGLIAGGFAIGGGLMRAGKTIPGVKNVITGIEAGLGKIYQGGYNAGKGIISKISQPVSIGTKTIKITQPPLKDSSSVYLGKSNNYRNNLLKKLSPEQIVEIKQRFGDELSGVDANHRLPPNILKNNPKGVSDLLRKIGIDDINDPRIMEMVDSKFNRIDHNKMWIQKVGNSTNLTADDIIQIWFTVETSTLYPIVYRPPGSVSF